MECPASRCKWNLPKHSFILNNTHMTIVCCYIEAYHLLGYDAV
jgi:hypothetical protein